MESLMQLIGTDRDGALLRMTIANALLLEGAAHEAEQHLVEAAGIDPGYTAVWKLLGKIRQSLGDIEGAREAWQAGSDAAQTNGDKQAEKEMGVFLKRLDKKAQESRKTIPER